MAETVIVTEEIIYSRKGSKSQNESQDESLKAEDLLMKCIEFDQDCFYDIRMLIADENQTEWTMEILPEFATVPPDYFMTLKDEDGRRRKYNLNKNTYDAHYDRIIKNQIEEMQEVDRNILARISVQRIVLLGSTQDGLYLEQGVTLLESTSKRYLNYSDIDIVFEYEGIEVKPTFEENTEEPYLLLEHTKTPGYFKLRIVTGNSEVDRKPHYFRNIFLKIKLYSELEFTKFYLLQGCVQESENMASIYGNTENEFGVNELDYVAAFKMRTWPNFANAFKTRQRHCDWPPTDLVQKVVSEGCGFVPKGMSTSRQKELEWRVSFAVSEKILVRSLSKAQVRAYLFFKTILKQMLNEPEGLSSYMMKNILFWTLETVDSIVWQDDTLLSCVEALVDMLCACLDKGLIVSYFLPSLNLIAHLDQKKIQILARKAELIQEDVFNAIVRCAGSSEFMGICHVSLPILTAKFSAKDMNFSEQCSLAYFTMYLYLRLQVLRYQLIVNLRVLKKSFVDFSRSFCSVLPPRAVWYLVQSIIHDREPGKCLLFQDKSNKYILKVGGLRRDVFGYWRSSVYSGIFKSVISDQELVTGRVVEAIPEFSSFVDWVDMTVAWGKGEHIRAEYMQINIDLD